MRNILFLRNLYFLLFLFFIGCSENNTALTSKPKFSIVNHDVSYIPFNAKLDNPNFTVCDSTSINSGRNRLQYIGGKDKLKRDIISNFSNNNKLESFSGYIVIRFLVNCEGQSGRYRAQSLDLDFSPLNAPPKLLENFIALIKNLDTWKKSSTQDSKSEYSKYINLKISDGQIQHVLL